MNFIKRNEKARNANFPSVSMNQFTRNPWFVNGEKKLCDAEATAMLIVTETPNEYFALNFFAHFFWFRLRLPLALLSCIDLTSWVVGCWRRWRRSFAEKIANKLLRQSQRRTRNVCKIYSYFQHFSHFFYFLLRLTLCWQFCVFSLRTHCSLSPFIPPSEKTILLADVTRSIDDASQCPSLSLVECLLLDCNEHTPTPNFSFALSPWKLLGNVRVAAADCKWL